MNRVILGILLMGLVLGGIFWIRPSQQEPGNRGVSTDTEVSQEFEQEIQGGMEKVHPLTVEYLRRQDYSGSELTVEEDLAPGSNYSRQIVSYESEGLTQYALLTIPKGDMPAAGWPAIVFNHGYIPPEQYRTTEKYVAYVDGFARNGYVVLRPDYRGHGDSEGDAEGGYGSPAYTIDVLNGLGALKKHPQVDEQKIGMWGHSMGGHITLRAMVVDPSIKAGVIWGGVVGSYQDYQELWWGRRPTPSASPRPGQRGFWRWQLREQYGDYQINPAFWDSISVTSYFNELSGAVKLIHAKGDETVPYQLSVRTKERLDAVGASGELVLYEGDNHNISGNFSAAMKESVDYFDTWVKQE